MRFRPKGGLGAVNHGKHHARDAQSARKDAITDKTVDEHVFDTRRHEIEIRRSENKAFGLPEDAQDHSETYDLSADLSRLIEDGEILCEAAELTLHHEIEPAVTVHADRALLRQVFQNLLSNAIKYNRPSGSVRLRLAREEGEAVFTIHNTGAAIPAEIQPRLFERFFRGDKAHNRQTDGFGLGLNIAAEFARANHATLKLVSSGDDQTTFEVRLAAV